MAKALDVIGEWWSPLIVRNLMLGIQRFDTLQAELGICRNILTDRLAVLIEGGVVARSRFSDRSPR